MKARLSWLEKALRLRAAAALGCAGVSADDHQPPSHPEHMLGRSLARCNQEGKE